MTTTTIIKLPRKGQGIALAWPFLPGKVSGRRVGSYFRHSGMFLAGIHYHQRPKTWIPPRIKSGAE